ncbi:hypothetical protein [Streptomyces virginiae]|uniref:hypothetical protein n=1 Tax=Streptomyces virginiae TaxID=1961 RepID=UPI00342E7C4A
MNATILQSNPGLDTLQEMEAKSWRDRVRQEDELVEQLQLQVSQAAKRRAEALLDGVAELGSVAEVARALGKSWNAIDKAIKKNGPGETGPDTTE